MKQYINNKGIPSGNFSWRDAFFEEREAASAVDMVTTRVIKLGCK